MQLKGEDTYALHQLLNEIGHHSGNTHGKESLLPLVIRTQSIAHLRVCNRGTKEEYYLLSGYVPFHLEGGEPNKGAVSEKPRCTCRGLYT